MKKCLYIFLLLAGVSSLFAQGANESNDFSYALKLYNQEFYDLSAQQFVKYYNNYPNSAKVDEAKYYAGLSYYELGNYNQARIEFQSLVLEYPKSGRAGEGWLWIGECYKKMKNFPEAAKAYESIRLMYIDNPFAAKGLYEAGKVYIKLNKTQRALQTFNLILDNYSASNFYLPAMSKAALCLIRLDKPEKAKNYINKVLSSEADKETKAESLYLLSAVLSTQGYFAEAKNNLKEIISGYSSTKYYTYALLDLGKILLREGNYNGAEQNFSKGVSGIKDSLLLQEAFMLLGDAYFLDNKYSQALNEYKKVNYSNKKDYLLRLSYKKAVSYKKQNLNEKAIEELNLYFSDNGNSYDLLYTQIFNIYVDWLQENGQSQKAVSKLYEQISSLKNTADKLPLTIHLVKILAESNQWREIIRELQPYLLMQEKYADRDEVVYYLAVANKNIGHFEESAYFYKMLVEEFGSSAYYEKALNDLTMLQDNYILDQKQAVLKLANLIGKLVNEKNPAQLRLELGKIYYSDLKDYDNAEGQLLEALNAPNAPVGDIYLYLGKVYEKLAEMNIKNSADFNNYINKAKENYTEAVKNISTCSKPDEASWLMVKASSSADTVSATKQKKYIEMLIQKYPNSEYKEEWYAVLAYTLAFDTQYYTESKKYYKLLIDTYKKSEKYPSYLYSYAKLIQDKNYDGAINYYKEVALDYPFASEAANSLFEIAKYYENMQKYDDASALYKKLINNYYYADIIPDAQRKLSVTYLKSGKYKEAITLLEKDVNMELLDDFVLSKLLLPQDIDIKLYLLARAYSGDGREGIALNYYNRFLNISRNEAFKNRARFAIGEIYYTRGQKITAVEYFKGVSKLDPDLYFNARLYIADIYFEQGDYKRAVDTYSAIENRNISGEKGKEIASRYIIAAIRQGELSKSSQLIKNFKKKYSGSYDYYAQFDIEYGNYYRTQKSFNKAIKKFKSVKKNYKKTKFVDDADYYLALTYLTLNKTEEAYKILSNFYTKYPKSNQLANAFNTLGSIYFRSEKYDAAINIYKRALEISEPDMRPAIMSNLIKVYSLTGFWEPAQAMAKTYVKDYPDRADVIDKKLIIAQADIHLGRYQEAVDYLHETKLSADSEREPEIQFYIGEALLNAGRYEDAIAEFVKIPLLSKKTKLQWEASALYYSGQAYEKLGRIPDAIRMYQEIVKRPGIDLILKKDAEKRIKQLKG
jgi:tetratricopeptide (TPR) repeat protein